MRRQDKKQDNQETENITAELTIVPQGQMVKPRTFIVSISKAPIRKLIEEEVNIIISNPRIKKTLRR